MPHTNILQEFKELKLYGMADAFLELTQVPSKQSALPKVWIESLLKSEIGFCRICFWRLIIIQILDELLTFSYLKL
jgi:hypothetical protein